MRFDEQTSLSLRSLPCCDVDDESGGGGGFGKFAVGVGGGGGGAALSTRSSEYTNSLLQAQECT